MTDSITANAAGAAEVTGNDILFECSQCGKSLVIDRRGAGLTIQCPDCNAMLQVPIPPGVDLTEIDQQLSDAVATEHDVLADLDLTGVSADIQEKIQYVVTELQELRFRRANLERLRAQHQQALQTIARQTAVIRTALEEIQDTLNSLASDIASETQAVQ